MKLDNIEVQQVANCPPEANADDATGNPGERVTLRGTATDPDTPTSSLEYSWTPITPGAPQLTGSNTLNPSFVVPFDIDSDTEYRYLFTVSDGTNSDSDEAVVTVRPLRLFVLLGDNELNPYPFDNSPTPNLQSNFQVSVENADGTPRSGIAVSIKACTVPSVISLDGHQFHDDSRATTVAEECNPGVPRPNEPVRPTATLNGRSNTNVVPLIANTGVNGAIDVQYRPPRGSGQYITGEDHIIVQLRDNPDIKEDDETIITRVPDLIPMTDPSKEVNCNPIRNAQGTVIINFVAQANHGCLFYGTVDTVTSLVRIGEEYNTRQTQCAASRPRFDSPACDIPGQRDVIIRNIEPMRITAVSSNWGGLLDIGPPNECRRTQRDGVCDLWNAPHASHTDGKNVDIGFGRNVAVNQDDRLRLLAHIIAINGGDLPVDNEGGDPNIEANHFHVRFPT